MDFDDSKRLYEFFSTEPLKSDQMDLYVDLDDVRGASGWTDRLMRQILLANQPTCQLLTGHNGSGKSTELRLLQKKLEDQHYFVVYMDALQHIDANSYDFPDILVGLVRELAVQLKDRCGIVLARGYFRNRWEDIKDALGSEVKLDRAELAVGMGKISAAIKSSPSAREDIRKFLEPTVDSWIAATNDVIGVAKQKLIGHKNKWKDLVVLVDNMDKLTDMPHPSGHYTTGYFLYVCRAAQLKSFHCHMVYTLPIGLAYSACQKEITAQFGDAPIPVVPMVKIRTKPPKPKSFPPGIQKLRDMIETRCRMAEVGLGQVFRNNNVCTKMIEFSGGQPRELMMLIREALVSGQVPVTLGALGRPVREGRAAYLRSLSQEHWPIIQAVAKTGAFVRTNENDKPIRELLANRVILQYVNDEEWYAPNPLIAGAKPPTP